MAMEAIINFIFIYLIIWWLVLFTVLPWGAHAPDNVEEGHASSAPDKPRLGLKMLITSVLTFVITAIVTYFLRD